MTNPEDFSTRNEVNHKPMDNPRTPSQISRYCSWSAYLSAVATILGFVTIIAFFIVGQPFGTINDVSSAVLALSTLLVLFALYRLHRPVAPKASLAALVIGVIAMLVATALQILLIIKVIEFTQTGVAVPVAFGVLGVSLISYGYLAMTNGLLPRRLSMLAIITGAGYVMVILGFVLGGQEHPLAAIGGLMAVICYSIWAIWFGRLLASGRLAV